MKASFPTRALATAGAAALSAGLCVVLPQSAGGAGPRGVGKISVTFLPAPRAPVGTPAAVPIRVANGLSGKAVGVTLTVTVPSWVRLSGTRTGARCVARATGVRCRLPDLAAGATVTVRLTAKTSRARAYRVVARASIETVRYPAPTQAAARSLSAAAPFRGVVSRISVPLARRMTGVSWRPGCPVGLTDLRLLTVSFWGFDSRVHSGTLIVHRTVAAPVVRALSRLYAARFPIRRMAPVDAYGGDDFRSIEADNTSAFNCRPATGSSHWSEHAYGKAIDLDPLENPYVSGGKTSHAASRRYLDRGLRLPGMIHAGDVVVRAFAAEGWGWGGVWSGIRDYQHFSVNAR
jgi:hypothetical protein